MKTRGPRQGIWLVALAVALAVAGSPGCGKAVDPVAEPVLDEIEAEAAVPKLRVAMTAAFVSEAGVGVYEQIATYLGDKLGMEVEFITGFSYSTVDTMLNAGAVDVGFVCGCRYAFNRDQEQPTVQLLAAPVMKAERYKNQPKYFSDVIVHKDSTFQRFTDLKGCTYVYSTKFSNSGYNMPRAKLVELGETGGFFGKVLRSGSHEESIRMVAAGEADASSVDSLVLDYDLAKSPEFARQVKVIETLGPAGIPAVVVNAKVDPELVKRIQAALVGMKSGPEGRRILDEGLVDRFEIVDDANYDDVRQMKALATAAGFLEIK